MSTLTLKATHVGPRFVQHIAAEFGIHLVGMDVTGPVPRYAWAGPEGALCAMNRKYFLGEPPVPGEFPCIP